LLDSFIVSFRCFSFFPSFFPFYSFPPIPLSNFLDFLHVLFHSSSLLSMFRRLSSILPISFILSNSYSYRLFFFSYVLPNIVTVAESDRNSLAVAQAVSPWLPTAAARLHVRTACGVCGGQSGIGGRFSQSTSVSPANHSTNFSIIIIITRGWHNTPISGRRVEWVQLDSTPHYTNFNFF
jgi:hypothetical protein